jgi:hypothetical protein
MVVVAGAGIPASATVSSVPVTLSHTGPDLTFVSNLGTGTVSATDVCPSGTAITSIDWWKFSYLSGVAPVCTDFAMPSSDLTNGPDSTTGTTIGYTGTSGSSSCPAGDVVVGFTPNSGDVIDGFTPLCQGFSGVALSGLPSNATQAGATSGTVGASKVCANGEVATGIAAETATAYSQPDFTTLVLECSSITSVGTGFQPDLLIAGVGNGIYNTTGAGQTVSRKLLPGQSVKLPITLGNDGTGYDALSVAVAGSSKAFVVNYIFDGTNMTKAVRAGTFTSGLLSPSGTASLVLVAKAKRSASSGAMLKIKVTGTSSGDSGMSDVVIGKVTVK